MAIWDTDFWVRDEQIHEKYELYEHMALKLIFEVCCNSVRFLVRHGGQNQEEWEGS